MPTAARYQRDKAYYQAWNRGEKGKAAEAKRIPKRLAYRAENGLCIYCGRALIEGATSGKGCVNCAEYQARHTFLSRNFF